MFVLLAFLVLGTDHTALAYDATPLPVALKQHEVVIVASVLSRADGRVELKPELTIKSDRTLDNFQLGDTWPTEAFLWTPIALLEHRRYLLFLNRDDAGKLNYSDNPMTESVREVSTVDDTVVRLAACVQAYIVAEDAAGREQVLANVWTNESDETKNQVLDVLIGMERDEATVPYLVNCIKAGAPRAGLMGLAAAAISKFEYRETIPELLKALQKDDWACLYPAQALGKLKVREAHEPIMALITSPTAQNQVYFIEALCQLEDERSIPFLMETAQRNLRGIDPAYGTHTWSDIRVNEFAVAALGRLRATQATDLLRRIADQTTHEQLQELARDALEEIQNEDDR